MLESRANSFLRLSGRPTFIYGTAWKKADTTALVKGALQSGFGAIDTAAQPKHYQEDLVGAGIREALRDSANNLKRENIFVRLLGGRERGPRIDALSYKPNLQHTRVKIPTTCHTILNLLFKSKSMHLLHHHCET